MAGHNSLELEIHSLFQAGHSVDSISAEILSKYEKNDIISPAEAESLSHFLISAGQIHTLLKFYLKCLRRNSLSVFPWGFLAEAVLKFQNEWDDVLLDLIEMGLEEQPQEQSSFKSFQLVKAIPTITLRIQNLKKEFQTRQSELKAKLMTQLNQNRLYQLAEQEEITLYQLIKIFPTDIDVKLLHQAHLEKKADEILTRVKNPRNTPAASARRVFDENPPEAAQFIQNLRSHILNLAQRLRTEAPDQIYNLALLAMQFELYDLGLELIQMAPPTFAGEWLEAEILFESGRYLDLLKHIETIEKKPALTAETTYGAVYLKAQAYFGLGQKEIALRLLESLSDKAPSYRSTQALLHEWKNS